MIYLSPTFSKLHIYLILKQKKLVSHTSHTHKLFLVKFSYSLDINIAHNSNPINDMKQKEKAKNAQMRYIAFEILSASRPMTIALLVP